MITKDQVRRSLTEKKSSSKPTGSGIRPSMKGPERRSTRTNASSSKRFERQVNLERLTTNEFDELLGEGADDNAHQEQEAISKEKKTTDEAKHKASSQKNNEVVQLQNIYSEPKDSVPDGHLSENTGVQTTGPVFEEQRQADNNITESPSNQLNDTVLQATEENHDDVVQDGSSNSSRSKAGTGKKDVGVETNPTTVFCGCDRCHDLLERFYLLVSDAKQHPCIGSRSMPINREAFRQGETWSSNPAPVNDTSAFNVSLAQGERLVPLIEGCSVMIPLTKKSNLKHKIKNGDPQAYVNELMDIFFKPEEMAKMTAEGRTAGFMKMDSKIKDAILAYVSHKYNKSEFNFDKLLLTEFINTKCYCERRKLWKKAAADGEDAQIIKKLQKKGRNQSGEANSADREGDKRKSKLKAQRPSKYKVMSPQKPRKQSASKKSSRVSCSPHSKRNHAKSPSRTQRATSTPVSKKKRSDASEFAVTDEHFTRSSSPVSRFRTSSLSPVSSSSRLKRNMSFVKKRHDGRQHNVTLREKSSSPSPSKPTSSNVSSKEQLMCNKKNYFVHKCSKEGKERERASSHSPAKQRHHIISKKSPSKTQRLTTGGKRPKAMYKELVHLSESQSPVVNHKRQKKRDQLRDENDNFEIEGKRARKSSDLEAEEEEDTDTSNVSTADSSFRYSGY